MKRQKEKKILTTQTIVVIAMMSAITCILAPLSIPIGPVPISLTNLIIFLGIYILGMKKELISYFVYLMLGFIGLPVFSGFMGGAQKLLGPTGGYLIGFLPMILIAGIFIEKSKQNIILNVLGMILGTIGCYILGTAWLAWEAKMTFQTALLVGVVPFIVGDLIKIIIVALIAPQIQKRIEKSKVNM